jgi:hypothetical protein
MEARKEMIKAIGGEVKWNSLSALEQADQMARMMEKLVIELGKASFEMLSDDEKPVLKLFICCGYGCHKCLNTVCGGNAAMMAWWKEHDVPGPVLLANRDNAAVLSDSGTTSDTVTSA